MTSSLEKKHYELNRSRELEKLLPDRFDEGDVLRIHVLFEKDGTEFIYLAIKTGNGKWYFDKRYVNWRDMLFWVDENSLYEIDSGCIQVAGSWIPVQ